MDDAISFEEMFEDDPHMSEIIMWHLLNLLDGKVVIPTNGDFWDMAIEPGVEHKVVMRLIDGKMYLVAEKSRVDI